MRHRSSSTLQRKGVVHYCARCGKEMEYEGKNMVYLYKVKRVLRYRYPEMIYQTKPVSEWAYNMCDDCAKELSEIMQEFLQEGKEHGTQQTDAKRANHSLHRRVRQHYAT